MRRIGIAATVVMLALAFRLFEPVIVWNFGWAELPSPSMPMDRRTAADWAAESAAFDDWLLRARAELSAPSLSAAIAVDGAVVWAGAVGHADVEAGSPATTATVYRLGSSSKALTSVAMGVLVDRGAVDLDAPLARSMPDLLPPLATVTVRQAMSHTGGVRNYGLCLCFPIWEHLDRRRHDGSQRDTLRRFEQSPLLFAPGAGFAYTSLGFNALGGVIEAASGQAFGHYLRDAVWAPLGMAATAVEDGEPPAAVARFYEVEDHRYKLAFTVDNSGKLPAGGMLSTPSDMTRLGTAMLKATLFSTATRDLLITPQPLADGSANPQGYALGWRFNPRSEWQGDAIVTPRYSHHGTAQGSTSWFTVFPQYGLVMSVMMNKGQTNLDALSDETDQLVAAAIAAIGRRR